MKHSFQGDPSTNVTVLGLTRGKTFPNGMTIHTTLLRQHLLGTSIALSKRANGANDTLIEIPDWDFHWQREYLFETPPVVLPGEELYLECHWDNSAKGRPPRKARSSRRT